MKIFGFITARTQSTRLPNKMLLPIRRRSVIEHVIDRAKLAKGFDGVVLCTSDLSEDDALEEIAERNGILCFRGSMEDKLVRWKGAAKKYGADYFITFDGDDIFTDPELVELAINQIKEEMPDFLQAPKNIVCGAFTFGIKTEALKKVCEIKDSDNTEMMWVYFTDTGLFKVSELKTGDSVFLDKQIRMTLDYPEDLEFFKKIFDEFDADTNDIPVRDIVGLLTKKPEIAEINFFRQSEFLDNQKKKTILKLKS